MIALPVAYGSFGLGMVFAAGGAALILARRRIHGWVPYPALGGITLLVYGVAMSLQSAAALWIAAPLAAAGCVTAVVVGLVPHDPVVPPDDAVRPSTRERVRFLTGTVVPWLALYGVTVNMGLEGTAFRFAFEDRLPIYSWTSILYQTSYITVALAPWSVRTRGELRQLTIAAWVAMFVVFPFYWLVPSAAPRRPMSAENPAAALLEWERNTYPPTAAFPSFHVLWAIFVGHFYRPRVLGLLYVAAIAVSCITTGMHYIPDVLASLVLGPAMLRAERIWRGVRGGVS